MSGSGTSGRIAFSCASHWQIVFLDDKINNE